MYRDYRPNEYMKASEEAMNRTDADNCREVDLATDNSESEQICIFGRELLLITKAKLIKPGQSASVQKD